ncbi:MAG: TlpA family protein disulfide reductase [Dysgonamonadaceae bacterium]|jgi:peroxiredoxin|nr:TlpA family protein disulfide reductase [Dysgonamonadaceae bacterium]
MRVLLLLAFTICPLSLTAQLDDDIIASLRELDSITQSKIGTPYPDFTATSLDGKTISEKQLTGKVTIINFWFEACAPCLAEFDALNDLYHRFKDNPFFQFLSFTFDSAEDAKATACKFNIPYDVFSIADAECRRLNYKQGFPTTIIIDQSGKLVFSDHGGLPIKQKRQSRFKHLSKKLQIYSWNCNVKKYACPKSIDHFY